MTLLHEAVETKKMDVRMVERNITRGVLSREDFDKATSKLPDDSENAEWTSTETLAADDDDSGSLQN